MLLAFLTIFNILGFTNCTEWKFLQSAPQKDMRVIGTFKNIVYLKAQDGEAYCNKQNRWEKCIADTWLVSHHDAPTWFNPWFNTVPAKAKAVQLTLAGDFYLGQTYFALLDDGQIWSCPKNFKSETEHIVQSGAVIWLIIPIAIGVWCFWWFLDIAIKHGSPTLWDFWGRGTESNSQENIALVSRGGLG